MAGRWEVGLLCDADLARMERYEQDGTVTGVAVWGRVPVELAVGTRIDLDGVSIARGVQRTGGPVRVDSFGQDSGAIAREARTVGIRASVGCPVAEEVGRLLLADFTFIGRSDPDGTVTNVGGWNRTGDPVEVGTRYSMGGQNVTTLVLDSGRIVATADQTRRRIERDLHDGAQQRLVSLVLQLRAVKAAIPAGLKELAAELDGVAAGMDGALEDLREFARGIHPAILAEGGLGPALRTLARRAPVPVQLQVLAQGRLPEPVEVAAYYVVAEALANAAKHARAAGVTVEVEEAADGVLRVGVHDDGVGGADLAGGSGLVGLKDRVEALGGRISVESPRGAGTSVEAELPLKGDAAVASG